MELGTVYAREIGGEEVARRVHLKTTWAVATGRINWHEACKAWGV